MNNLVDITMYGKPSSTYEYMKMMIQDNAQNAGIKLKISEVQDTQVFVEESIDKIPSVKIEDNFLFRNNEDINEYILKATKIILENKNYGGLKRIIVPVDFSNASENAISYAFRFSKYVKSVVNLIHVHRPRFDDVIENGTIIKNDYLKRLKSYEAAVNKEPITNNTIVTSEVVAGFPAVEILNKTKQSDNSIVIMGMHRIKDAIDRFLGSVCTSVTQKSEVPVLLVPEDSHFTSFDKILYCSLDPADDINVIEELASIATTFDSEIHIVHVHNKEENQAYIMNEVKSLWKMKYPKNLIKTNVIYSDNVNKAIQDYAEENDIKLISLCRSINRLFKNILKTGLSDKLTSETNIPLLILSQKK